AILLCCLLAAVALAADAYFSAQEGYLARPPDYDGVGYLFYAQAPYHLILGVHLQTALAHLVNNVAPLWTAVLTLHYLVLGDGVCRRRGADETDDRAGHVGRVGRGARPHVVLESTDPRRAPRGAAGRRPLLAAVASLGDARRRGGNRGRVLLRGRRHLSRRLCNEPRPLVEPCLSRGPDPGSARRSRGVAGDRWLAW